MHDMTAHAAAHHAPPQGFIRKYVFSVDHKVIGIQYTTLGLVSAFIGMALSWAMRIHLAWPAASIPFLGTLSPNGAPGGVPTPEYYLSLMTMHGTIMAFFLLTAAPMAGYGNFMLPIHVGAADMAFPRLNMASFWVTFVGFVLACATFFIPDGPPLSGWTAYAPLSAVGPVAGPGQGWGQNLWGLSIALFCVASLLGALNFIVTTIDLRTKGMTLSRLPLATWAWFINAWVSLLAFAVLLPTCLLLVLDRLGGTSFFIPGGLVVNDKVLPHSGGSPLLFQHLFWFFGHPEVYIIILPAFGIVAHVMPTFTRKPLVGGWKVITYAMAAIGGLSFVVWGHHMFVSGMSPYMAMVFSVPTLIITIPSVIAVLVFAFSLYGANMRFSTPMLFCLGFISLFISGGIGGFFLAQPAVDSYLHATSFVVGHFHFTMGLSAVFAAFAGFYYWFPKMWGRMMNETLGKIHFWLSFVLVYCVFMTLHLMGLTGSVRRYSQFVADFMVPLTPTNKFITIAALLLGATQFIFLFNVIWSRFKGPKAADNPWHATTLEWDTTSPPPFDNFGGRQMTVYHGPMEYDGDAFVMQTSTEKSIAGT
ncbi:MAG TPA: cbb3-type cytochrome c oxidase subunit I [Candidatus Eremiobacteraceae bacterium]|nr:cbb3-type cytochrome c oxidase subunit I [Candidatus Eremiobacteraceae bacterium]